MPESSPTVVLVEPSEPGNVGTAARSMANFGFTDLRLIDPPPLDPTGEAAGFAGQARSTVLEAAETMSFDALVSSYHTVGFTSTPNEDATSHVRFPVATPAALGRSLAEVDGDMALVFGRERTGLTNDELARLDRVCSIPASPAYPALNLGQAVTIALYELRHLAGDETQLPDRRHLADPAAVERLHERFGDYLEAINHPVEKRAKTRRLFRRLVGRAAPTDRETATLTGIFRRGASFASPPEDDIRS